MIAVRIGLVNPPTSLDITSNIQHDDTHRHSESNDQVVRLLSLVFFAFVCVTLFQHTPLLPSISSPGKYGNARVSRVTTFFLQQQGQRARTTHSTEGLGAVVFVALASATGPSSFFPSPSQNKTTRLNRSRRTWQQSFSTLGRIGCWPLAASRRAESKTRASCIHRRSSKAATSRPPCPVLIALHARNSANGGGGEYVVDLLKPTLAGIGQEHRTITVQGKREKEKKTGSASTKKRTM